MSLQPNLDPANRTLVEREGVNAASDRSTTEDADLIPGPVASEDDDTDGASDLRGRRERQRPGGR